MYNTSYNKSRIKLNNNNKANLSSHKVFLVVHGGGDVLVYLYTKIYKGMSVF